jgi:hypothetical protein
MKRAIAALLITFAVLASGLSISAHHSFAAQYDANKPITLKGSITRIEWANPHIYFYIDVAGSSFRAFFKGSSNMLPGERPNVPGTRSHLSRLTPIPSAASCTSAREALRALATG